jgi:flagellar hook-basal body complex protein FliE
MIPAISGAIGPLGAGEWSAGSVGSVGSAGSTTGAAITPDVTGAVQGSFGGTLTNAISSLEQSQATATSSAQALATGQLIDPTKAVAAVENASLSMQLAAQLRDKLVSAENTIFQTQV